MKYELRCNNNPEAMPLGTYTYSRHRTFEAAMQAWYRADRRFHRGEPQGSNAWAERVIVSIDADGVERVEKYDATMINSTQMWVY